MLYEQIKIRRITTHYIIILKELYEEENCEWKKSLVTIVGFGCFVVLVMVNQTAVCDEAGSGRTENTKPALEIANQTGIKVVV